MAAEKHYEVKELTVAGKPYSVPMWTIEGRHDGPTLAITGGVHGAEYASIAAALEIGQSLDPATLHGRVRIVPVMNMPAFAARSIYICPLDGKNLNRVFPGNTQGTASEQIADWMFRNVLSGADAYVDLHGGDLVEALVPFTIFFRSGDARVDAASQALAKVFGIHYLVCSEVQGSTFAAASRAGVPSILAESGGQGIWNRPDVVLLTQGVQRVLKHLGIVEGGAPDPKPFTLLDKFLWLRSEHDAFWYPGVEVNAAVQKGQPLGVIKDAEGHVLQTANSPAAGRVLFIVTSLAINNGDPLLAVGA